VFLEQNDVKDTKLYQIIVGYCTELPTSMLIAIQSC